MMVFKASLFVIGYALVLAGWTAEGTVTVISAVAFVLIPAITTLVTSIIKILRRVDEIKDMNLKQNSSLNRIEDTVQTPGTDKLPEKK